MSMLSVQIDELRLMGNGQAAKGEFTVAALLREAADTIENLRDSLQVYALGSGTCNPEETETITYYNEYGWGTVKVHVMECDECGGSYEHVYGDYEHCPRCGKRVEGDAR